MSNKFREKNIKIRLHYCFDDMINIKNLDPSEIKKDKESHKNIHIYCIWIRDDQRP